jgi:hypothetical protein
LYILVNGRKQQCWNDRWTKNYDESYLITRFHDMVNYHTGWCFDWWNYSESPFNDMSASELKSLFKYEKMTKIIWFLGENVFSCFN